MAGASICDAVAGNLVANCGFEGGVYSDTVGGTTNNGIPNGWTPNAAFVQFPSFNGSGLPGPAHSGNFVLSIGNFDSEPPPVLTQTLSDIVGDTYAASVWVYYSGGVVGDPAAFLDVEINGTNQVALNGGPSAPYPDYALETFSFVGTGSDVLGVTGNTNPGEWYVDDVVVTDAVSAVPEPASIALFGAAFAALACVLRRGIV
jgi:hypothetical protein